MLRRSTIGDRHFGLVHIAVKLYLARTYNVGGHLGVTTHHWMHTRHVQLITLQQCPRKSHGVRTNTVEMADIGTLDRCLRQLGKYSYTQSNSCLNVGQVAV